MRTQADITLATLSRVKKKVFIGENKSLARKRIVENHFNEKSKKTMTPENFGKITLYNGDCMEYLRMLPDNAFSLAVCDPPWGIDIGNGLGSGKKTCKMHHSWQFDAPDKSYFDELMRVSRNQIIWGGNYFTDILPPCDNWIIWDKLNPNLTFAEGEMAWCSIHKKLRIFKHYSCRVDGGTKIHPCQKPIALYQWILQNYANDGDTILDTFLGSGSICIAAHDLGFELTGIEIDKEYYEAGKKRLIEHMRQLTLF